MKTSIATVCLSGTLEEKLKAAAAAGFDGVEIFEPDLIASPLSPEQVRQRADDLSLTLDLYQPFRDFEGVGPATLQANLRRAETKFTLMNRLGIETMLLCSNVATAKSGDDHLAAEQLRQLADVAQKYGVRVAYEALAWGRFVSDFEHAARIVRMVDHPNFGNCLDSFHILSRNWSPEAIEAIAPEKIFFVQLADAPLLDMDVLSWSRHHRRFPGEGGFDLVGFCEHLFLAGYEGPLSLEVFNDIYRQSDPFATAVDALRSLRWLQEQSTDPRRPRRSLDLPPVQITTNIDFVEVRAAERARVAQLFGQLGLQSRGGHRSKPVELWAAGDARIVLGNLTADSPASASASASRVTALGFQVQDPLSAQQRGMGLGSASVDRDQAPDEATLLGIHAPDETEVFFSENVDSEPAWVNEFELRAAQTDALFDGIDHVNLTQPWQSFDAALLFYRSVVGLEPEAPTEVAAPTGLVRSQVLRNPDGSVRVILNLAPSAAAPSAIPAQHVAIACSDIIVVAQSARARGLPMLPIPQNYYDDLVARFDLGTSRIQTLQELDILYDRDQNGEFLHFYTNRVGDLFVEVVQRLGRYDGYGAPNAPVRLGAQHERS